MHIRLHDDKGYFNADGTQLTDWNNDWDLDLNTTFCQWLTKFMKMLTTDFDFTSKERTPNKAVLFTTLPGQSQFIRWFLSHSLDHTYPDYEVYHIEQALGKDEQVEQINLFWESLLPSVLITTEKLGSCGLNLQFTNHVVILQKFWNFNNMWQALAQISRIGEKSVPHGWILHMPGCVDDRVMDLQAERLKIEAQSMHGLDFEREDYGLAFHPSKV
jgi:hypothetical protein